MILPRRFLRIFLATLLLSIAAALFLPWISQHQEASTAALPLQSREGQSSIPSEESVITRLFDLSGQEVARFAGHFWDFSPDGQHLLTSSNDGAYRYSWSDLSGERVMQFNANSIAISPDGQRLIVMTGSPAHSFSAGDTLTLYESSGHQLSQLQAEDFPAFSFDITPDSQQLAIMANDRIYLLNAASGQETAQIEGQFAPFFLQGIRSGFDPMGQWLALHGGDPLTCKLFDRSGRATVQLTGTCLKFSPNGQKVIILPNRSTRSTDLSMQIYDIASRKTARLPASFPRFSPDGKFILLTNNSEDSLSYLYRSSGEKVAELQGKDGRFSPDSQRLLMVSGNTVSLYNLSGRRIAQLPGTQATFLPKGSQPITFLESENAVPGSGFAVGETRLFDASGQELALLQGNPSKIKLDRWAGGKDPYSQITESGSISILFASSDGQYLVTSDRGISYLYQTSGKQIAAVQGTFHQFNSIGQHFMTQSSDRFYLFDIAGKKLAEVERDYPSYEAWFNPDGQRFVLTTENKP